MIKIERRLKNSILIKMSVFILLIKQENCINNFGFRNMNCNFRRLNSFDNNPNKVTTIERVID